MRFVASVCGSVLLACVLACGGGGAPSPRPSDGLMAAGEMLDLNDSPAKYKGKTLKAKLQIAKDGDGVKLRESLGKWVWFEGWTKKGSLDIAIRVPETLAVPDAKWPDTVIVTFVCSDGDLKKGNEAKAIERP